MELEVNDPFVANRAANAPTSRVLEHGQDPVRLHLGEDYTFTCQTGGARPHMELEYSFTEGGMMIEAADTEADPDPEEASSTQLFESTRNQLFKVC